MSLHIYSVASDGDVLIAADCITVLPIGGEFPPTRHEVWEALRQGMLHNALVDDIYRGTEPGQVKLLTEVYDGHWTPPRFPVATLHHRDVGQVLRICRDL